MAKSLNDWSSFIKKGNHMTYCGCEGSCPVCRIGEVDDYKCNICGVVFCPVCHGITNKFSPNVVKCSCKKDKLSNGNE